MKVALGGFAIVVLLAGCGGRSSSEPAELSSAQTAPPTIARPVPTPKQTPTVAASAALASLSKLLIKGRAPKTGYSRAQFGPAWSDDNDEALGHNGCDTRNDILRRDLMKTRPIVGCRVQTGVLADPYTATQIPFTRGVGTSAVIEIDHVVALGDAWQTGAQEWTASERQDFGNDPLNLLAVNGTANIAKGDSDAASWLPPNKPFRCAYVSRQIAVKLRYKLWVTAPEKAAMSSVLRGCPGQKVPTEASPTPTTSTARSITSTNTSYANCAAVKKAGKAPLLRGQPGYSGDLDRDGDGVACEN